MGTRDRDWARAARDDDPAAAPASRLPLWQWIVAVVLVVVLVGTAVLSAF